MNLYSIYVLDMASLSQQKSFEVHFAVLYMGSLFHKIAK